jgi:hypothetical protein
MPQPLYTGVQNLPFTVEFQDRYRQIVHQFFHTDVFMLMSQLAQAGHSERMVIEQVMELQGEKAAILGTRVGNLQSEGFGPIISRFYDIEARAGRIPDPPDVLVNTIHGPVEIEYLGMLAQAQTRLTTVRFYQTGFALTDMAVKTLGPQCTDVIDDIQTMRDMLSAAGYPAKSLRTDKAVLQIRQIRNKKQEQLEQIEATPKLAKAAAAMGKAGEEGSPLQLMMGGGENE